MTTDTLDTVATEVTIRVGIADLQRAITSVVAHAEKPKQGADQPLLCRVRLIADRTELLVVASDGKTSALAAVHIAEDDRKVRFEHYDGPFIVDLFPKQARQIADFLTPNKVDGEMQGDARLHLTLDAITITDVSGKWVDTSATVPTIEQEPTAELPGTGHFGFPPLQSILAKAFAETSGTHKPLVPEPGMLSRFEIAAKEYGREPVFEPIGDAQRRGWLVWVGSKFVGTLESRHGDDDSLKRREAFRRRHLVRLGLAPAIEAGDFDLGDLGEHLDPDDDDTGDGDE